MQMAPVILENMLDRTAGEHLILMPFCQAPYSYKKKRDGLQKQ
jgi:hypothetical protein